MSLGSCSCWNSGMETPSEALSLNRQWRWSLGREKQTQNQVRTRTVQLPGSRRKDSVAFK